MSNQDQPQKPRAIGNLIQHFDNLYRSEEHTWGIEPSAGIEAALPFLVPGRVLDLGSGDGRNGLYLAHRGFDVTAVDIAPAAIENLARYATRARLTERIRGVVADIDGYEIGEGYENIISTFTLHFLPAASFLPTLDRIMQATLPGGVNALEDFTQDGPLFTPESKGYFLAPGELRRLYEQQGWQVLYYDERKVTTRATGPDGQPYSQGAAAIVARKP